MPGRREGRFPTATGPGFAACGARFFLLAALACLLVVPAYPQSGAGADGDERQDAAQPAAGKDAQERERTAEEDPLAKRQSDRVDRVGKWLTEPDGVDPSASARIRYDVRDTGSGWDDGGSRAGLSGQWQFRPQSWLFGRAEAGFNLLRHLDTALNSADRPHDSENEVFTRLAYAGVETSEFMIVAGKNWSTYYQVAGFTDRFESTGGSASGVYNAGTDGGNTGTGRADRALQARLSIDFLPEAWWLKPFNLNLQVQHGEPIPQVGGVHYGTAFGVSAILKLLNNSALGIAYNRAEVPNPDDPRLRAAGIDGDAHALLLGARRYGERWYAGATISWLENHEATDESVYFDGRGAELYGSLRFADRWWLTAGWNYLRPASDQAQAGAYRIHYGVLGVRYTFREFARMLYAEMRLDDSGEADGTPVGNVYTFGVRWDFP